MRYFLETSYEGTHYGGFQIQENANTIQAEIEAALQKYFRQKMMLTGSSRTDAGVHALQNFFHFDSDIEILPKHIYSLNALLPNDVVINNIKPVESQAHSRFQALSRTYNYFIYSKKNPFIRHHAWFYPYPIDVDLLNQAAKLLMQHEDFTSFSKRNTQTKTKLCQITQSFWEISNEKLVYIVTANRFLRGMVRGLVGTMLLVGRQKISLQQFEDIILAKDCTKANFATPAHGLFLVNVSFK